MEALRRIRELFPRHWQPFVAGFGNRITDTLSYRAVGLDLNRVFIIDPKGVIQQGCNSTFNKSYSPVSHNNRYALLKQSADLIFPPLNASMRFSLEFALVTEPVDEQYNDLAYWRPAMGESKEGSGGKMDPTICLGYE